MASRWRLSRETVCATNAASLTGAEILALVQAGQTR